jgi:hypothetical protein
MVQSPKDIFDLSEGVKDEILVDFRRNSIEEDAVEESEESEESEEEDVEEGIDNNSNCVGLSNNLPFMLRGDHNVTAMTWVI